MRNIQKLLDRSEQLRTKSRKLIQEYARSNTDANSDFESKRNARIKSELFVERSNDLIERTRKNQVAIDDIKAYLAGAKNKGRKSEDH